MKATVAPVARDRRGAKPDGAAEVRSTDSPASSQPPPSSQLRPAYVAIIERQIVDRHDPRGRKSTTRSYVTATGDESMDCGLAYASRDRRVLEAMIAGVDGGRVLEWMLSDGRING